MTDLEMLLRDAIGRIEAPAAPIDRLVAAGHQRVRRGRIRVIAVAAACAVAAGGTWAGLTLGGEPESTPVVDRNALEWSDRDVPWVDGEGVHFGAATMPRPDDLVAVVNTLDMAFVQTKTGLTWLWPDGKVLAMDRPVIGRVQADPFGHFVVWAETPGRLIVVDTRYGSGRNVDKNGLEVTSVRGTTATVIEQGQSYAVDLTRAALEPIDGADGVRVIGLTDDWILGESQLLSRDGLPADNVVGRWAEQAFDRSGRYLVRRLSDTGPDGKEVVSQVVIMDLDDRTEVTVDGLEGRPDKVRWDPSGELIVRMLEGDAVRYYSCSVEADCRAIGSEVPLALADGPESPAPDVGE